MHPQVIVIIIVSILILYRIYLRVRRTIGWQRLNPKRMQVYNVIYFVVGMIFLVEGGTSTISILSEAAGILIGVVLAYYGAAVTRMEKQGEHSLYRPNTWVGGAVTLLFFGRIIYRFYEMYTTMSQSGDLQNRLQSMSTGWTSGLLLIMFSYYIVYNMIILRKQKQLVRGV